MCLLLRWVFQLLFLHCTFHSVNIHYIIFAKLISDLWDIIVPLLSRKGKRVMGRISLFVMLNFKVLILEVFSSFWPPKKRFQRDKPKILSKSFSPSKTEWTKRTEPISLAFPMIMVPVLKFYQKKTNHSNALNTSALKSERFLFSKVDEPTNSHYNFLFCIQSGRHQANEFQYSKFFQFLTGKSKGLWQDE